MTSQGAGQRINRVLIVNGGARRAFAAGELNAMLARVAGAAATAAGATYELTDAFEPFDPDAEVQRYFRADLIVYQTPAW